MTDRCLNLYPAQPGSDGGNVAEEIAKNVTTHIQKKFL
jgi:hypothetical protein